MTRWQRSVTLRAIRENKVSGFDCEYCAKEEDFIGRMGPVFRPHWYAAYLGDLTSDIFDNTKECQTWIRSWADE